MVLSDIINKFTIINSRHQSVRLFDIITHISANKIQRNTGLSRNRCLEHLNTIRVQRLLHTHTADISILIQDYASVYTEYKRLKTDSDYGRLSKDNTRWLLTELLQDDDEYKNIDLMKMFRSKHMTTTVICFQTILMSYITNIVFTLEVQLRKDKRIEALQTELAEAKENVLRLEMLIDIETNTN